MPEPRDYELDPAVVLIPDGSAGHLDTWFASLRRTGPATKLTRCVAEELTEIRG